MNKKPIRKTFNQSKKFLNIFIIGILFLISFYYLSYGYKYYNLRAYHYDEGMTAYGAALLLDGGLLYRDFNIHEFPGQYYLLAAVFKMFGISINVQRLFAIAILTLLTCSIYVLINKLASKKTALLAFFLSLSLLKIYMVYARAVQTATFFSILTCFPLVNFIYSDKKKWLIIAGIFTGITVLFRQDFGFYTFIAVFLIIGLKQLESCISKNWVIRLKLVFARELYLLLGICLVLVPTSIYFIQNHTMKNLIFNTIIFPLTVLYKDNPQLRPFPILSLRLSTLVFYLPLFVFLLIALRLLVDGWHAKSRDYKKNLCLLLFLLLGIGFFNYCRSYCCISHLLYAMIFAILLFVFLYEDFCKKVLSRIVPVYRNFFEIMVFLVVSGLLFYSIKPFIVRSMFLQTKENKLDIVRLRGFYDDSELAKSQVAAIKYIQNNTSPDEKIFVGNERHDKVVNSDVVFYFLSARYSATKYCELNNGTTKKAIQNKIIADIKKNKIKYIILCSVFSNSLESYENVHSSGIKELDNFIQKNYKIEKVFGPYVILKRTANGRYKKLG